MTPVRSTTNQIAYIDLFAGPGRYQDGTQSTPLLVLKRAIGDPGICKMLVTLFNDKDQDNSRSLERAIKDLPRVEKLEHKPEVMNEEVGTKIVKMFQELLAPKIDWPANVWMGVSVENSRVLPRVDDLRKVPAAVRLLSCEPLIGSVAGIDLSDIHWVIVGGESGWGARPMNIEWVREIFRACRKQDVPFFFKQWGGVRKDLTGRLLRRRTYDEMPARVAA
jgi:protein gp37